MNDAVSTLYSTVVSGSMSVIAESLTIAGILGLLLTVMPWASLMVLGYFLVAVILFNRITRPVSCVRASS